VWGLNRHNVESYFHCYSYVNFRASRKTANQYQADKYSLRFIKSFTDWNAGVRAALDCLTVSYAAVADGY
jgi:hypothetical protein